MQPPLLPRQSDDQANTARGDATVDLHGVCFGYSPANLVLQDITASVRKGRICALIGPNAAGKSTLLNLMLGQLTGTRGTIHVNGESVATIPPARRASMISFVPQRPASNVTFRIEQIIAMGRFALPVNDDAVEAAIEAFDLPDIRDRVYSELSVGQQQRVAMARAWAQAFDAEPARHAMLLDEPISAMDLKHAHLTMRQLRSLADRGFSVVTVLHDLNLTAMYADDVWLLDRGQLIQAGPWQDVLQPSVLEPVYDVAISRTFASPGGRPLFRVADPATMTPATPTSE